MLASVPKDTRGISAIRVFFTVITITDTIVNIIIIKEAAWPSG